MKSRYRRMLRGMKDKEGGPAWFLYILRCGDGSLYTGVTTDIDRRLKAHQEGKASRYTRTHRPVELVYREECGSRSQALIRECAVKSLPRERKEEIILTAKAGSLRPKRKEKPGSSPRSRKQA